MIAECKVFGCFYEAGIHKPQDMQGAQDDGHHGELNPDKMVDGMGLQSTSIVCPQAVGSDGGGCGENQR